MAVPSSYNDITQDQSIRDHIGWVWYDRTFFQQPKGAADQRLYLRFEGVHYYCMVVSLYHWTMHVHTQTLNCPLKDDSRVLSLSDSGPGTIWYYPLVQKEGERIEIVNKEYSCWPAI